MVSSATPPCAIFPKLSLRLVCLAYLMLGTVAVSKAENGAAAVMGTTGSVKEVKNTSQLPEENSLSKGENTGSKYDNKSLLLSAITAGELEHVSDRGRQKEEAAETSSVKPPSSATTTTAEAEDSGETQVWYSTAGWLPSRGLKPDKSVNLTLLPMLAFAFFLFGVCIKCYSWVRDQDRTNARGQLDFEDGDEVNYHIITAGEQGYREVDIRSDSTSMYDTVTSFRSLRLPFNDNTITSIKSLPNQPYETYRSIVLQKADEGVYDSVHSYKAFLEKTIEINEVDIEVELVDDYTPRPRSKSCNLGSDGTAQGAPRSRKRRLRRHSGGRSVEGSVKTQAERERFRRHSEKSAPPQPHPESIRSKTFHRRSSPAILEPLLQGTEFKIPLEQSDEEEESTASVPHGVLNRQSSCSSSSTSRSSGSSCRRKESSYRHRKEKARQKRASQDHLAERLVKASSHSSGHCSDDSPRSSCSSKGSSSNELDSESDVTDSGLVVDVRKPAKQSCFKTSSSVSGSQLPSDLEDCAKNSTKKVHRFKVSFVDDAALSATSD